MIRRIFGNSGTPRLTVFVGVSALVLTSADSNAKLPTKSPSKNNNTPQTTPHSPP